LSARALVDVEGPHGWSLGAVNLGRLTVGPDRQGITWGRRDVLPLVEVRVPCTISQMELDTISRGAKDTDLEPVSEAARRIAAFEEHAVYLGFSEAHMRGIVECSEHEHIAMGDEVQANVEAVSQAVKALHLAGVDGPYALVLSAERYQMLMQSTATGFPLAKVVARVLGGPIRWSPVVKGGVVMSTRGGDFESTIGQDLSVGYAAHDRDNVELYLTESFAFRVLEPSAAVVLE
jgi:uncharacterized linocin/CFP29 family protein